MGLHIPLVCLKQRVTEHSSEVVEVVQIFVVVEVLHRLVPRVEFRRHVD